MAADNPSEGAQPMTDASTDAVPTNAQGEPVAQPVDVVKPEVVETEPSSNGQTAKAPESVKDLLNRAIALMQGGSAADLVEPEDDELGDDIKFVKNGWIRITINGVLHKLRRPFLGELRDLEGSMEAGNDEIQALQASLKPENDADVEKARAIADEAKSLDDDDPRKAQLDDETVLLTTGAWKRNTKIIREAERLRADWWAEVFETLTPPNGNKPEQLPAWIIDQTLQGRVVAHWRAVPLASGS